MRRQKNVSVDPGRQDEQRKASQSRLSGVTGESGGAPCHLSS